MRDYVCLYHLTDTVSFCMPEHLIYPTLAACSVPVLLSTWHALAQQTPLLPTVLGSQPCSRLLWRAQGPTLDQLMVSCQASIGQAAQPGSQSGTGDAAAPFSLPGFPPLTTVEGVGPDVLSKLHDAVGAIIQSEANQDQPGQGKQAAFPL